MNSRNHCLALAAGLALAGCHNDAVSSTNDAKAAYLGLDPSIDKAINLGFAGFNAANSANIPAEMTAGAVSGSLTVTGQVDQGNSANKGMRLIETLVNYSDDGNISYATTVGMEPALTISLRSIPNGTMSGTLTGQFLMSGMEHGAVTLNLSFTGNIQPLNGSQTQVQRTPGSTHITGTATSVNGTYNVDITR
jgi:hypothetical protein